MQHITPSFYFVNKTSAPKRVAQTTPIDTQLLNNIPSARVEPVQAGTFRLGDIVNNLYCDKSQYI